MQMDTDREWIPDEAILPNFTWQEFASRGFHLDLFARLNIANQAMMPEEAWDIALDHGIVPSRVTYFDTGLLDIDEANAIPVWNIYYVDERGGPSVIFIDAITGELVEPPDNGPGIQTCDYLSDDGGPWHIPLASGEWIESSTYCRHPQYGDHMGWDFGQTGSEDWNDPIFSVAKGNVSYACDGYCGGLGNHVRIVHSSDTRFETIYAHMDHRAVGYETVKEGRVVGYVGNTGNASSYHLHFETRRSGSPVNPQFKWKDQYKNNQSGYLPTYDSWRWAYNNKVYDDCRIRNGGSATVGAAQWSMPVRMGNRGNNQPWGYKMLYNGGSFGECAVYYETNGCDGYECAWYENIVDAYLVRSGFYQEYRRIGETESCLGFPRGDEQPTAYGAVQYFRKGRMEWRSGRVTVFCQ
ncbi:MAG: peptidoglycan DD-metalloendopeptidase family protein [Candidatus Kerfeldbacteria bacterium]|nr:peptidoglycan DD-metalloendopeptidase family protein [Candidatus Kerfeldbacteria bacterium]